MQIVGSSGTVIEGDATLSCFKVSPRWPQANGAYFVSARTGLLTTAALTASMFNFLWGHPTLVVVVKMLRVRGLLTTPPTAAQEWGLEAIIHRRLSSTGWNQGTSLTVGQAGGFKKYSAYPNSGGVNATFSSALIQVPTAGAATAAPTAGTFVTDVSPFMADVAWELAAGVAVPRSRVAFERDYSSGVDAPLILSQGEALDVRNSIAIGAGGVLRASVDLAWDEVDPSSL